MRAPNKQSRIQPGPGQESVWDYPRPPRLEPAGQRVQALFAGETIADSTAALRILETGHPPTIYIPREDVRMEFLAETEARSFCEWKGRAHYFTIQVGDRASKDAAWTYPSPHKHFAAIAGYLAFYPSRVDACYLDEERVRSQEGDFYGGWVTCRIVGPFKGGAGTWGW